MANFKNVTVSLRELDETTLEIVMGPETLEMSKAEFQDYILGNSKRIENLLYNVGVHLAFSGAETRQDINMIDVSKWNNLLSGKVFKL